MSGFVTVLETENEDTVIGPWRTRDAARRWAEKNVPKKIRWWIARYVGRPE